MNVKQVIVIRTKYINKKGETFSLRRGKCIAQGSHASSAFIVKQLQNNKNEVILTSAQRYWVENNFAKICLQVDTEEELLQVYNKALNAGLEVNLITDSGKTEFDGIPTVTCIAIGPDFNEKIDDITRELKLY